MDDIEDRTKLAISPATRRKTFECLLDNGQVQVYNVVSWKKVSLQDSSSQCLESCGFVFPLFQRRSWQGSASAPIPRCSSRLSPSLASERSSRSGRPQPPSSFSLAP